MANPAYKREVLAFDSGTTFDVILKYGTGKQVSNGRIMFTTADEAVFFVDSEDADKIYDLRLQPQEPLRITKKGRTLNFSRVVVEEQPVVRPAAPSLQPAAVQANQQDHNNSLSKLMASSYISAIDALLIAQQYAESKGIPFKISAGELRASSHCIFIAMSRQVIR